MWQSATRNSLCLDTPAMEAKCSVSISDNENKQHLVHLRVFIWFFNPGSHLVSWNSSLQLCKANSDRSRVSTFVPTLPRVPNPVNEGVLRWG